MSTNSLWEKWKSPGIKNKIKKVRSFIRLFFISYQIKLKRPKDTTIKINVDIESVRLVDKGMTILSGSRPLLYEIVEI